MVIVKPETVIDWHRKGFRLFGPGRFVTANPGAHSVSREIRQLIRKMSRANPLWGAPRIHGELLKLGIDIGETSVGKYIVRSRKPPSQTWRTFLANHVKTMVSVDFFTVPTIRFHIPGSGSRPQADRPFQRHRPSDGGVERSNSGRPSL